MPRKVTSTHPEYDAKLPLWVKTRDAIEGEEAVKAKTEKYLRRLTGQRLQFSTTSGQSGAFEDDPYLAYLDRAMWFGAPERTVKGLSGAIMRKRPDLSWPGPKGAEDPFLETVGAANESLDEIVANTVETNVGIGRYGLLIEAAEGDNSVPFLATYEAESVRDWDEAEIGGKMEPILIILREEVFEFDDKGKKVFDERYRVLKLGVPDAVSNPGSDTFDFQMDLMGLEEKDLEGSFYFQEIWVPKKDSSRGSPDREFEIQKTFVPRMFGGRLMERIPFVFLNPTSTKSKPEKPTILDLVNVCFSIFRSSADLEHGRHFTALPTAVVAGPGNAKSEYFIGSAIAWILAKGATWGFLEFTGSGLGHIANGILEKKKDAAVIGSRLLEEAPAGVEAMGTVKLRQAGEQSVLSRVANSTSEGLTKALRFLAEWLNLNAQETSIKLNTDFIAAGIDPKTLTVLMAKLQAGTISFPVYFFNLERGEVYPEGWTIEDEIKAISVGVPMQQPNADEDNEDEPDMITTGSSDGHTHTFRPGDSRTSEEAGHSHQVVEEDGAFRLEPATTEGASSTHTHTVPSQGAQDVAA